MTKFIVEYYPIIPSQWLRVEPLYLDDDKKNPEAEVLLTQYYLGIDKCKFEKSGVVSYNNSWFAIIEADTIRDATIIFWDKLELQALQYQMDQEERLKKTLRDLDKMKGE